MTAGTFLSFLDCAFLIATRVCVCVCACLFVQSVNVVQSVNSANMVTSLRVTSTGSCRYGISGVTASLLGSITGLAQVNFF